MTSPWRTMHQAAEYLQITDRAHQPSGELARLFLVRHQVPLKRVGRSLRVHIDDLNGAMRDVPQKGAAR